MCNACIITTNNSRDSSHCSHLKTVLEIAYRGVYNIIVYIINFAKNCVILCCLPGIKDEHRNVRNSALFAIGQFAEHLQVRNN